MGFGETLVAMFGILCGTSIMGGCVAVIYRWVGSRADVAAARALRGSQSLEAQLHALREEVRQLREQNADLILGFDTTLQRLAAASQLPSPNGQASTSAVSHPGAPQHPLIR